VARQDASTAIVAQEASRRLLLKASTSY